MAKVVNDPQELPVNIIQLKLSRVPFLSKEFLDSVIKKTQPKSGIKKNNYYLVPTDAQISWLQPTKQLQQYHYILKMLRIKKGYTYLMIINDKDNV
jgi:hypothetical protein